MSRIFTKEEICSYLARKLIPCRPEFQIRKIYDKKYEYIYNAHLLGGYSVLMVDFTKHLDVLPPGQGTFKKKIVYVNPDTQEYLLYKENGEEKKGKLPNIDKFKNLHNKGDFWTFFSILEVAIEEGNIEKIFYYPLDILDRAFYEGNDYCTLLGMRVYNPGSSTILTEDDESKIIEYCKNRYQISICENLNDKKDESIEEWIIYLDHREPKYKVRGRDGKIYGNPLDKWTYSEAKQVKPPQVSTSLLLFVSSECPIYFDYFRKGYIDHIAAKRPDCFRKIMYILNDCNEKFGFSLVRVLVESDAMAYYRQTIKYKQLIERELDALVTEGKVQCLTKNLYRLPKIIEPDHAQEKQKLKLFPFKLLDLFAKQYSLYWAKNRNVALDDLAVYRYAQSINSTLLDAVYRDELKLHHPESGAVFEYHDDFSAYDYYLDFYEARYLLNKNSILEMPEIEDLFPTYLTAEEGKVVDEKLIIPIAEACLEDQHDKWESKARRLALEKILNIFNKWKIGEKGNFDIKLKNVVKDVHFELAGSGFSLKEKPVEKDIDEIKPNDKEIYLFKTNEGLFSRYKGINSFYAAHVHPIIQGKNIGQLICNKDFINIVFQKSEIEAYFEVDVPLSSITRQVHWYDLHDLAKLDNDFPKELLNIIEHKVVTQEKMNRTQKGPRKKPRQRTSLKTYPQP